MNQQETIIGNLLVVLIVGYLAYWIWSKMDNTKFKIWIIEQWENLIK